MGEDTRRFETGHAAEVAGRGLVVDAVNSQIKPVEPPSWLAGAEEAGIWERKDSLESGNQHSGANKLKNEGANSPDERAKLAERAKHMFPGVQRAVENWRWLRGEVGVEGLSL